MSTGAVLEKTCKGYVWSSKYRVESSIQDSTGGIQDFLGDLLASLSMRT